MKLLLKEKTRLFRKYEINFVNGAAPTTVILYGSSAGTQPNVGQGILTLAAGSVISLVNYSSASAVTLAPNVGGTEANVRASIVIKKIA